MHSVFLGDSLVSWHSNNQKVVSWSSTKSEYRDVVVAATEVCWVRTLLDEIGVSLAIAPTGFCDNLSFTYLAQNLVFHARTKHIEIDFHFV